MAGDHGDAAALTSRRRILCLTGPESTGKTTLAEALAAHFRVPLVEEVARGYLAGRSDYSPADVLEIARLQMAAEARSLAQSEGLVVCDTDLLVIQVWWEERYGELPAELTVGLAERSERHYLLMKPDLAWSADPLRENPDDRDRLFARYRALLAEDRFSWTEVGGEGAARLAEALAVIARSFPELG
jgi:nicotinamide riboside kinase